MSSSSSSSSHNNNNNNNDIRMEEVMSKDNHTVPHAVAVSKTKQKSLDCGNNSLSKPPPPHKAAKRSTRKGSWKWPKDRPRRPLTAYNLFFQYEREKLLRASSATSASASLNNGSSAASSSNKVGGFAGLARSVAAKWKTLSKAEKQIFEAQAVQDKCRYNAELKVWTKKKQEEETKNTSSSSYSTPSSFSPVTGKGGAGATPRTTNNKTRNSRKTQQEKKTELKSCSPPAVSLLADRKARNTKQEQKETRKNSSTPPTATQNQNGLILGATAVPFIGQGLPDHLVSALKHKNLSINHHHHHYRASCNDEQLLTRALLEAAAVSRQSSYHHFPAAAGAALPVAALQPFVATANRFDLLSRPEVVDALDTPRAATAAIPSALAPRSLLAAAAAAPSATAAPTLAALQEHLQALARQNHHQQQQQTLQMILFDQSLTKAPGFY